MTYLFDFQNIYIDEFIQNFIDEANSPCFPIFLNQVIILWMIKNLYQYMQRWVYSKLLWWGQPPNISKNLLSNLFRNLTKIILMLVEDLDHISRKTKHFFLKLNKYLTWIAWGLGYYSTMSTFNISSSRLNRDYSFL